MNELRNPTHNMGCDCVACGGKATGDVLHVSLHKENPAEPGFKARYGNYARQATAEEREIQDLRNAARELRAMRDALEARVTVADGKYELPEDIADGAWQFGPEDAIPDHPEGCDCSKCEDYEEDEDEEDDEDIGRLDKALAVIDELRLQNANLRQQLDAARTAHDFDREQIRKFDKDYREKCNELHALQDPKKRTGREAQLLLQLGQAQAEVFDLQAQLREANHQRQVLSNMRPEAIKRMAEHEAALLAYRKDVEYLENQLPGASAKLTPGTAARALRALEKANPTYYEELCRDLNIDPGKKL